MVERLLSSRVRKSFIERFGEDQAFAIEKAALDHFTNGATSCAPQNASDVFQWALLVVIDLQCISEPKSAAYHGITIQQSDFLAWCREHGKLAEYKGEIPPISLLLGCFDEYIVSDK